MLALEVLGTPYLIESDRRWRDFLAQLWAPFVVPANEHRPVDARICEEESGWSLDFSAGWGVEDDDPWSLANEMRNALFSTVLGGNRPERGCPACRGGRARRGGSAVGRVLGLRARRR